MRLRTKVRRRLGEANFGGDGAHRLRSRLLCSASEGVKVLDIPAWLSLPQPCDRRLREADFFGDGAQRLPIGLSGSAIADSKIPDIPAWLSLPQPRDRRLIEVDLGGVGAQRLRSWLSDSANESSRVPDVPAWLRLPHSRPSLDAASARAPGNEAAVIDSPDSHHEDVGSANQELENAHLPPLWYCETMGIARAKSWVCVTPGGEA